MVQKQRFAAIWCAAFSTLVVGFALAFCAQARAEPVMKIVAYGDSLTAGYGVSPSDAFPAQLERALRARGHNVVILNSGVSGDTVSAGLERFDWAIPDDASAVIVEFGANDGLRGMNPQQTKATLDLLLAQLKARKLPVLLTGMRAPKNWGDAYAADFDAMFPALAEKYGALLYQFFLDGVILNPALNQSDGIHPTGKGVAMIVDRILPQVEALIAKVGK